MQHWVDELARSVAREGGSTLSRRRTFTIALGALAAGCVGSSTRLSGTAMAQVLPPVGTPSTSVPCSPLQIRINGRCCGLGTISLCKGSLCCPRPCVKNTCCPAGTVDVCNVGGCCGRACSAGGVCDAPYQLQGAPTEVLAAEEPARPVEAAPAPSDRSDARRRRDVLVRAAPSAGLGLLGSGLVVLIWRRGAAATLPAAPERADEQRDECEDEPS